MREIECIGHVEIPGGIDHQRGWPVEPLLIGLVRVIRGVVDLRAEQVRLPDHEIGDLSVLHVREIVEAEDTIVQRVGNVTCEAGSHCSREWPILSRKRWSPRGGIPCPRPDWERGTESPAAR